MKISSDSTQGKSQLFQLIALGFSHPVAEFHRILVNGSYSLALAKAAHETFTIDTVIGQASNNTFADFEAAYIQLFQLGRRGKPRVHLNAGDYEELIDGQSRPLFLLEHTDWYKHFGLKVCQDEHSNELPDHIVCQFEFMAWLAHLEQSAGNNPDIQKGYQRAQRDFCHRHLQPFLALMLKSLKRETVNDSFFLELTTLALDSIETMLSKLNSTLGETATQTDNPDQIASVNLWG